jgi:WD40-like Beta Propeller Repeat
MRILLLALLAGSVACRAPGTDTVAVPRTRLAPAALMSTVTGMNYDPSDTPLAWTKDGRVIIAHEELYSSADVFNPVCAGTGFYEISLARHAVRPLATGDGFCKAVSGGGGVSLHPDGESIVYSGDAEINRSRFTRTNVRTGVTDTLATGCRVYEEMPAISPDGQWVAGRGLCVGRDEEDYRVFIARLDGSGHRLLPAPDTGSFGEPAWSPDGKVLAMVRSYGGVAGMDRNEVWVMGVEGLDARRIARGSRPSWSPTGEWIAYVAEEDSRDASSIRLVAPNGERDHEVFRNRARGTYSRGWGPFREGAAWGPLVWSPDGRELLFARRYDAGISVWRLGILSGKPSPLTAPGR